MGQRLDALNKGLGLIWDRSKSKFDPIYFSNCEEDKDFQGILRGKYNMLTSNEKQAFGCVGSRKGC